METPEFIQGQEDENPGLNFEALRSLGIKYIQDLTGAFWTDYNEHDPGVTILEQLCYALTDLSYRAGFTIQDILFQESTEGHAFHAPKDIFPSNPLTIQDYRKLIIDQVKEVRNVWFTPTNVLENSLKGLYTVYVDLGNMMLGNTVPLHSPEEEKAILKKIREVFNQHRNLCEDIEDIIILEPLDVTVYADIEVDRIEEIEKILAKIYFSIDRYFNPEIHFYGLQSLLQQGLALQEIYTGPLLRHGFIRDQDLSEKLDRIVISEIIKIIMDVNEVISVKNLSLLIQEEYYDNQFIIPRKVIPRVIFGSKREKNDFTISFYKNGVNHDSISNLIFQRKLNELISSNKRVYREQATAQGFTQGKKLQLEEYYSIQNQFPGIYGIGEFGIPGKADPQRKGQAKQLKGFLLLFEQIMANYLSQLAHMKELFSLEAQLNQTYFFQALDNVPQVERLYCRDEKEIVRDVQLGDTRFPKDYYLGLEALMKHQDNFSDRRNRFLDFLLAIHGEAFTEYAFAQKNHYFAPEDFDAFLIQNKTRFLKHLPTINKNRVRACNYLLPPETPGNLSGLETKLSILLGLNQCFSEENEVLENGQIAFHLTRTASVLSIFDTHNIKVIDDTILDSRTELWNGITDVKQTGLEPGQIDAHFDFVDEEDFLDVEESNTEDQRVLKQTAVMQSGTIHEALLRNGLHVENYQIGQPNPEKKAFFLLFQYPELKRWLLIAEYTRYEDALRACKAFLALIRTLNVSSEGFYLLEHLLLRPDVAYEKFGFYLLDEEGNHFLRSIRRFDFSTRIQVVKQLRDYIESSDKGKSLYENFVVVHREDKDFEIRFKSDQLDIELVSYPYQSVQEIHKKLDKVYEFIADKEGIIPFEDKIAFYIQYEEGKEPVPEDFFNYNISMVFPQWTVRFHHREFKAMVENLVHENKPACVRAKVLWLNTEQMKRFESLYADWTEKKQKLGTLEKGIANAEEAKEASKLHLQDQLNRLNHHFLEFLLKLHRERT